MPAPRRFASSCSLLAGRRTAGHAHRYDPGVVRHLQIMNRVTDHQGIFRADTEFLEKAEEYFGIYRALQ